MKFKRYIIAILAATMAWGCTEEIIEVENESAVTPEIALARVSGINGIIISSYRRLNEFGYYGQSQILNAEALADNLVIANNTGRYTGQVVNAVGSHFGTWSAAPYRIINDCNLALKHVDASAPALGTSEAVAAAQRQRYKGEAHFLRALAYHDLVKVYGYEPGREVAGWNEGVVIRTEPTEKVTDADKRSRSTNAEVYALIVADLTQAIALLPDENAFTTVAGDPNVFLPGDKWVRASKQAARALLAKVYLYLEDWPNANLMATSVMSAANAYPGVDGGTGRALATPANYAANFATAIHPESIFEISILPADWSTVDGVNNSMASITNSAPVSGSGAQFAVAGSNELIASFEQYTATTGTVSAVGATTVRLTDITNVIVGSSVTGTGIGAGARVVSITITADPATDDVVLSAANAAAVPLGTTLTFSDIRRTLWVNNSGRWECKKWQGEKGTFLENIPLIRIPEVYLIAAEARANLGLDALTPLNALRAARGVPPTAATGAALLTLIANERRVELCFEGHRFFDLKRREQDIVKPASLGVNNVPYNDHRILAPVPNAEITYNTSLEQNPEY